MRSELKERYRLLLLPPDLQPPEPLMPPLLEPPLFEPPPIEPPLFEPPDIEPPLFDEPPPCELLPVPDLPEVLPLFILVGITTKPPIFFTDPL
jgi:hypothetical protein